MYGAFSNGELGYSGQKPALGACSGSTGAATATGYTGMTLTKSVTDSGNFDVYALGTASAGTAVNNLVLCFAYSSNYLFQISSAFQMSGPSVGNEDCTLTETCSLQLSGVGLADTNKLRIIASGDNCGSAAAVTSITGLSGTTSVTTGGSSNVYAVASSAITAGVHGSGYKLCWGHNPSGNSHYMFEVGTFTLNGAAAEDFTCPLTDACSIQLSGTGLANTNNVKVQGSGTTCSTGASTASGYTGMTLDQQVTNSGGFDVYALGTASAGVAGSTLVLCFAYSSNYLFEVGTSRRALSPTVLAVLFSTKIQVQQR